MKNVKNFKWNVDCQIAFEDIKRFLAFPPLLSRLTPGETLYLYLSVGNKSLALVLVQDDKGEQNSIYYMSKVLRRSEIHYPKMGKLT